jgi:GTP-binding protein
MPEYAFIGRSNVGKSSLINMLTGTKTLAKISETPGKTQLINYFLVNESWYLVDLPGYGYAKVSKDKRKEFSHIITSYILKRSNLTLLFVLIDSRLEPQQIDIDFINWLGVNRIPLALIFTKTDKTPKDLLEANIEAFKNKMMEMWEELPPIFTSSAITRTGREEVLAYIDSINANFKINQPKKVERVW